MSPTPDKATYLADSNPSYEQLTADVGRYREALKQIADGSWNFGNLRPGLTVMTFAREVLGGRVPEPLDPETPA